MPALLTSGLLLVSLSLVFSSGSVAAQDATPEDIAAQKSEATAFVDSVHEWGAWGLDIEPAAGGIQPQSTGPLNARGSKLSLRTNSIAALAPKRPPVPINNPPQPTPVAPPEIPVTPPPPPPPVTPPVGGPTDGLF